MANIETEFFPDTVKGEIYNPRGGNYSDLTFDGMIVQLGDREPYDFASNGGLLITRFAIYRAIEKFDEQIEVQEIIRCIGEAAGKERVTPSINRARRIINDYLGFPAMIIYDDEGGTGKWYDVSIPSAVILASDIRIYKSGWDTPDDRSLESDIRAAVQEPEKENMHSPQRHGRGVGQAASPSRPSQKIEQLDLKEHALIILSSTNGTSFNPAEVRSVSANVLERIVDLYNILAQNSYLIRDIKNPSLFVRTGKKYEER